MSVSNAMHKYVSKAAESYIKSSNSEENIVAKENNGKKRVLL